MPFGSGESNVRARLSEVDIGNIFILRDDGLGVREIARIVGVSPSTISRILNGKTWRHYGEAESEGIRGFEGRDGAA